MVASTTENAQYDTVQRALDSLARRTSTEEPEPIRTAQAPSYMAMARDHARATAERAASIRATNGSDAKRQGETA